MAVRSGRRVVNPPWALFLNVVDIVSVGRFYNFMQPQRAQTTTSLAPAALGPCASSRAEVLGAPGGCVARHS